MWLTGKFSLKSKTPLTGSKFQTNLLLKSPHHGKTAVMKTLRGFFRNGIFKIIGHSISPFIFNQISFDLFENYSPRIFLEFMKYLFFISFFCVTKRDKFR